MTEELKEFRELIVKDARLKEELKVKQKAGVKLWLMVQKKPASMQFVH